MKTLSAVIKEILPGGQLPELAKVLTTKYDLEVDYGTLGQNMVLHAVLPQCDPEDEAVFFAAQEDATLVVIDEFFSVIAKAPPKIYPLSNSFCEIRKIAHTKPVSLRNMIEGHLVVISKYNNTYLVSSKKDVHAYDPLVDGGTVSINSAVLDLLERANPYKGVDALFENRYDLPVGDISYTFILSPKDGEYTDAVSDYELHLVGMYNVETEAFYSQMEMLAFCSRFNLTTDHGIEAQHTVTTYSIDTVKKITETRCKRPNVKGVILNYSGNETRGGYLLAKDATVETPKYKPNLVNYNRVLQLVAKPIVENNYIGAMQMRYNYEKLIMLVKKYVDENKTEILSLFQQHQHSRTAFSFYTRVEHHPFRKVLMNMYRKRINSVHEMFKVVNTAKLAKELLLDSEYSEEAKHLIEETVNVKRNEN